MTNQAILQPKEDDRYLAVVVPKNSFGHRIANNNDLYYYVPNDIIIYSIPKNNYAIIGLLSQMTEEQAKGFVEHTVIWMDITRYRGKEMGYILAKDALQSFIESSGLTYTSEQDILIIKIN